MGSTGTVADPPVDSPQQVTRWSSDAVRSASSSLATTWRRQASWRNAGSWPSAKEAVQIYGLRGLACAFELITELLQRHSSHGLLHGSDRGRSAKIGCYSAEETGTGNSAFEGPSFVCGQSAPDPVILAGLHGPSQAGVSDLAAAADDFCFVGLVKRGVAVPKREEQLWVLVQAGSTAAPRHQDQTPCTEDWGISIMRVSSTGALWVSLGRSMPTHKSTSRSLPSQRIGLHRQQTRSYQLAGSARPVGTSRRQGPWQVSSPSGEPVPTRLPVLAIGRSR